MDPTEDDQMLQWAPFPYDLQQLVREARCWSEWEFTLVHEQRDPPSTHSGSAGGLTMEIVVRAPDPYNPVPCDTCGKLHNNTGTRFLYPVPAATYDQQTWMDWLMDCVEQTSLHEVREAFYLEYTTVDGDDKQTTRQEHVFAPNHGPGRDPYRRYSYSTDEQKRTSFRGEVKP